MDCRRGPRSRRVVAKAARRRPDFESSIRRRVGSASPENGLFIVKTEFSVLTGICHRGAKASNYPRASPGRADRTFRSRRAICGHGVAGLLDQHGFEQSMSPADEIVGRLRDPLGFVENPPSQLAPASTRRMRRALQSIRRQAKTPPHICRSTPYLMYRLSYDLVFCRSLA
jgi:hypothetical protein